MTQQTRDTTLTSVAEGVISVDGKDQARFRVLRYGHSSFARYFLERQNRNYTWVGGVAQEYGADDLVQIMASLLDAPASGTEKAAEAGAPSRQVKARALAQTYGLAQHSRDGAGAYDLYQNVEQDEHTAFLSCTPCGCTVTSCDDGRTLAAGAFERGWRTRVDGRALCPDCAAAEPALALLSCVTEDDGGAHLACSLCSWDTIDGFSASAVAETAAEGGWQIGANGRAVCPTCLLEATVPQHTSVGNKGD